MPNQSRSPRISVRGLGKRFPGVLALDRVNLDLFPAEVLAVVGENGAGKSTLMKVLSGNQHPDSGQILVDSKQVSFRSPAESMRHGIAMIHQELNLADNLSIAENLLLGREPHRFGWIAKKQMLATASTYLQKVGLDEDPRRSLSDLSIGQKQLVEIAKALITRANVLIMDEPTSSLSHHETQRLMELITELRRDGVSIVYISHRLAEVMTLADRVEVLRDGRNAGTLEGGSITHDNMVRLMVGRDPQPLAKPGRDDSQELRLKVDELRVFDGIGGASHSASLVARSGEIVVLAGLVGAGRSELLETIFGARASLGGEVWVGEKILRNHTVTEAIAAGVAMVTEDRKATGLFLESSVRTNTTISALSDAPAFPWILPQWEAKQTATQIESLGIKTATQQTAVATLSGGNQQKIAIAKWLIRSPRVLLLDEPTRGVDIAARQEIYSILMKLASSGVAMVVASSDMEEVIAIADRVIVMHEGRIMGELTGGQIQEEAIMQLAVGGQFADMTKLAQSSVPNSKP